jgi:hypothetical protein
LQLLEKINKIFGLLEPKNGAKNMRWEVNDYLQVDKASNPRWTTYRPPIFVAPERK